MTRSGPNELFVYGTLLPGQKYFRLIAHMIADRRPARTRGRLFHLPFGYPALAGEETGWVRGELLSFTPPMEEVLREGDRIEGYQPTDEAASLFIRVVKKVEPEGSAPLDAWCYCLSPARLEEFMRLGQEVVGGDWLAFLREQSIQGEKGGGPRGT